MTAGEILVSGSTAPDGSTTETHLVSMKDRALKIGINLSASLVASTTTNTTSLNTTSGLLSLSTNVNNRALRANTQTLTSRITC